MAAFGGADAGLGEGEGLKEPLSPLLVFSSPLLVLCVRKRDGSPFVAVGEKLLVIVGLRPTILLLKAIKNTIVGKGVMLVLELGNLFKVNQNR